MTDLIQSNAIYLVYIGGMFGILLLLNAIGQIRQTSTTDVSVRTKRLKMLSQGMSNEEVMSVLLQSPGGSPWAKLPIFGAIPAKMQQAGLQMKPARLLLICCGVSLATFAIGTFILGPLLAFAPAVGLGLVLPLGVIEHVRQKRIAAFAAQLPEALELMSRGLSVGHPLNVSIGNVAKTMPDPIGTEFGLLADQIAYGEDLPEAFQDLARRIDQEDMHYLAASVSIQHGTGGNLGAMLATLARVIRARYGLRRKVKAISSEGRASAKILSVLPIVMYATTSITSPDYYAGVSAEPLFLYMAIAVVGLIRANALILRKLVNFRI